MTAAKLDLMRAIREMRPAPTVTPAERGTQLGPQTEIGDPERASNDEEERIALERLELEVGRAHRDGQGAIRIHWFDVVPVLSLARDGLNANAAARDPLCGVASNSGPNGEPLACAYPNGHDGLHSWATLPTYPAPSITATERAALDRLAVVHHPNRCRDCHDLEPHDICGGCLTSWPCDEALVIGLARRAGAATTPDATGRADDAIDRVMAVVRSFEESSERLMHEGAIRAANDAACMATGARRAATAMSAAATPRAGGADAEYAVWQSAVRATEAMEAASVEYDEALSHIGPCRIKERAALDALRAAIVSVARPTTPRDSAGGAGTP
jgi:hypothetical protein